MLWPKPRVESDSYQLLRIYFVPDTFTVFLPTQIIPIMHLWK